VQAGLRRVFTHGEYWPNDPLGYEKAAEVLSEPRTIIIDAPNIRSRDNKLRRLVYALKKLKVDPEKFIRSAMRDHHAANTNASGVAKHSATQRGGSTRRRRAAKAKPPTQTRRR
jgi:hypothetical protein